METKLNWTKGTKNDLRAIGAKREFYIVAHYVNDKLFYNLIVGGRLEDIPYGNLDFVLSRANKINATDSIIEKGSVNEILDAFMASQKEMEGD